MCMFCRSLFVLLAIVLSDIRFTNSDYPFGIFKLFFWCSHGGECWLAKSCLSTINGWPFIYIRHHVCKIHNTSCFNKYTTADDISPYHISQLLFQQIHNSRWHFTLSHITKAKYSRWLHWKVCSVFRSSRNSTFLSFTRSFHVHISAFLFSWFIIFNATFNNISVISWQSVLLVEETGVPGENHRLVASHWQTLSHNVLSSTPRHKRGSNSQL